HPTTESTWRRQVSRLCKKGDSMQNIWLFQANPKLYDLAAEIRPGEKEDWLLPIQRQRVSDGDSVVLWQSGAKAGIYGFGKISGRPFQKDDEIWIYIEYV